MTSIPLIAMLAADYRKNGHRIKYPCYGSVKYDGVRCLAKCVYDDERQHTVVTIESRTGQPYHLPHLVYDLTATMEAGDVWDGEIYLHGEALQDIGSAVDRHDTQAKIDEVKRTITKHGVDYRKPSKEPNVLNPTAAEELENAELIHRIRPQLQFHVFDVKIDTDMTFEERLVSLRDLEKFVDSYRPSAYILFTEYDEIESEEQLKDYWHPIAVDKGFEGYMLRNKKGKYENGKRSADLQKYKTFIDMEFQITEMHTDKDGNAVFGLRNNLNERKFTCVLGTHDERKAFLEDADNLIGGALTCQFQTRYKKTLLPQFPTGKLVRKGKWIGGIFLPSE